MRHDCSELEGICIREEEESRVCNFLIKFYSSYTVIKVFIKMKQNLSGAYPNIPQLKLPRDYNQPSLRRQE